MDEAAIDAGKVADTKGETVVVVANSHEVENTATTLVHTAATSVITITTANALVVGLAVAVVMTCAAAGLHEREIIFVACSLGAAVVATCLAVTSLFHRRWAWGSLAVALVCIILLAIALAFSVSTSAPSPHQTPGPRPKAQTAGWLYLADVDKCSCDGRFNFEHDIPAEPLTDYTQTDILIVGPIGVQSDPSSGHKYLGFTPSDQNFTCSNTDWSCQKCFMQENLNCGSLAPRFRSVVAAAKEANPSIKIIASIWWTSTDVNKENCYSEFWGRSLCALAPGEFGHFATSARSFMAEYGIDGIDIDFESDNQIPTFGELAKTMHESFLGEYELTASVAFWQNFVPGIPYLDKFFLQTYAGGTNVMKPTDERFRDVPTEKLFYGVCSEENNGCATPEPTIEIYMDWVQYAQSNISTYKLGGVHNYRLNSATATAEQAVQRSLSNWVKAYNTGNHHS